MENQHLLSGNSAELIAKLEEKFSIKKAMVYKRLEYLKIKPFKEGRQLWLSDQQLADLEGLHEHMQATGTMDGYKNQLAIVPSSSEISSTKHKIINPEPEKIYGKPTGLEAFTAIQKSAQTRAAGTVMFRAMLESQYIENPELLPEELRQQIAQVQEEYATKVVDPLAYADALMQSYSGAA